MANEYDNNFIVRKNDADEDCISKLMKKDKMERKNLNK